MAVVWFLVLFRILSILRVNSYDVCTLAEHMVVSRHAAMDCTACPNTHADS
jgi:hypothetical protein